MSICRFLWSYDPLSLWIWFPAGALHTGAFPAVVRIYIRTDVTEVSRVSCHIVQTPRSSLFLAEEVVFGFSSTKLCLL